MRLENLIADIDEEMFTKIVENRSVRDKDARDTAKIVGLAAIKYGDLSNQATKDYIFDVDRFTSFEGNTGPYILYTIVRIKSILNRYVEAGGNLEAGEILPASNGSEKNLIANQLSPIYFYNAGTVMRREYLMEGKYYSTEIFVLVDRGFVKDSLITEIPASTFLCIYCNGFEKEKEYMGRLVEEIRTRDYQVTGDYICEVVAEVPMDMQERGMFLRLQVPVSFRKNTP